MGIKNEAIHGVDTFLGTYKTTAVGDFFPRLRLRRAYHTMPSMQAKSMLFSILPALLVFRVIASDVAVEATAEHGTRNPTLKLEDEPWRLPWLVLLFAFVLTASVSSSSIRMHHHPSPSSDDYYLRTPREASASDSDSSFPGPPPCSPVSPPPSYSATLYSPPLSPHMRFLRTSMYLYASDYARM
ncbi:hypothetical protein D9613_010507 [Agrocybe pediades]|uniref:Uncharacterized protein n=1 Tax=Agrocybe pediades TaxID=84607 RepID=A0A8H4QFF0_9AGAR|nr:hypothetical protein D9613_010507 [Agrocybe pediades]